MSNDTNIILKAKNLAIGYHSKKETLHIEDAININIKQGELIGVIGQNGIGKSTLLRTLVGVQQPLKGDVTVFSKKINTYTNAGLAKIVSLVLTDTVAATNLSVTELIALGRQPHTNWIGHLTENDKTIIKNAIKNTSIEHLQHKKCYELSDGEFQKVLIARAIAQDTPLIVLDEPTTHLDLYHKITIFKLLKNYTKNLDKSILFSTHDINLAIQQCDKLIVMTKTGFYYDSPEHLINTDIFNKLFSSESIVFDKKQRNFIAK